MKKFVAMLIAVSACATPAAFAGEGLAGLYVGGNLGFAAPSMTTEDSDCWYNCSAYTQRPMGLGYGIQGGQNFVSGGFIYGWMLDYTLAGIDEKFEYGSGTGALDDMLIESEFKSAMSLRGKAGLVIQDTALILSFGFAQGDFETLFADRNNSTTNQALWDIARQDGSVSGLVFGAGVEHVLSDNLIIGADMSKYAFDTDGDTVIAAGGAETGSKVQFVNSLDAFRITLSYKF